MWDREIYFKELAHGVVKVKVTQSCPTLCDPMDYTVHRILQSRIREWVASPFSRDLPNPRIKPRFPDWQADFATEPPGKTKVSYSITKLCTYFYLAYTFISLANK